ncbi:MULTISPECIES: cation:proton antiporter [unclassified Curtobacterium]|uniref:cation:proton antiporter n=1 Tax=Bacteria TaxID=2 RepID=UPI0010428F66|nr:MULTISPECIES: cation:proton antiporter [unclassified Curtobacterium]TCL79826.1 sodium/proton antiporter (CPA1 family) [Curtobacterium sp. PhB128]TCL98000.1 sodium/proton antiporter (CPA1 family) [Curtobacterium sp. PhB138]TCU49953.1 sodium/proton antiporter (CPA1 family) [Curtobacterium sp. PhB146]TCU87602.1 sodium/proton antiporter (CPA1 family) [Curtobacterium sp. PhB191]TDW46313.1 sodium/proton antiporter (CPA1 family) [Curtobacterium sp. PhB42]
MTELLVVGVIAVIAIAGAAVLGPRIGVAAPLVLVAVGVVASLLPFIPNAEIEPEWILAGVLPPLLYSSAVSMPSMNFRREFGAISGLSVLLVVASSLVLGLFFAWVVPGLGFWWGIALGAIVSPTDAVATSIVKQTSVSRRAISILDGESLLNDATALVLLRTAIVAAAASFSFWGALGDFAGAVAIAVVIGWFVGWLNVFVRSRVPSAAVNTALSFAVPFVAAVPTEHFGGSGLVAAVVAGLFTGIVGPRKLPPGHRLSDAQNWQTIELVLEGAVFLTMGLELATILRDVQEDHSGIGPALLIAVGALVLTVLVRTAYVVPLLFALSAAAKRGERMQDRFAEMHAGDRDAMSEVIREHRPGNRAPSERELDRFTTRVRRTLADIAYYTTAPLGWREGTAVVWAGMRGAVTVAAAQTLPTDTPERSLLVFVAFAVALLSLVVQGSTIGPLLRRIAAPVPDTAAKDTEERGRLLELMRTAAEQVPGTSEAGPRTREELEAADPAELRAWMGREKARRLAVLEAQRAAILDARDDGTFDAEVLESMLQNLDAEQIALELRGAPAR